MIIEIANDSRNSSPRLLNNGVTRELFAVKRVDFVGRLHSALFLVGSVICIYFFVCRYYFVIPRVLSEAAFFGEFSVSIAGCFVSSKIIVCPHLLFSGFVNVMESPINLSSIFVISIRYSEWL